MRKPCLNLNSLKCNILARKRKSQKRFYNKTFPVFFLESEQEAHILPKNAIDIDWLGLTKFTKTFL